MCTFKKRPLWGTLGEGGGEGLRVPQNFKIKTEVFMLLKIETCFCRMFALNGCICTVV